MRAVGPAGTDLPPSFLLPVKSLVKKTVAQPLTTTRPSNVSITDWGLDFALLSLESLSPSFLTWRIVTVITNNICDPVTVMNAGEAETYWSFHTSAGSIVLLEPLNDFSFAE